MTKTDANPPMPLWSDEYQLVEVDADYLSKAVKPKQFIHIDQSECIMCEGCVDICPWKCIHMVSPDAVAEAQGTEMPGADPSDNVLFIIDDDVCTRCALCVAESMKRAVESARALAQPGDVVLLSPGCTSYDWYSNYGERGDDFMNCVKHLSEHRL